MVSLMDLLSFFNTFEFLISLEFTLLLQNGLVIVIQVLCKLGYMWSALRRATCLGLEVGSACFRIHWLHMINYSLDCSYLIRQSIKHWSCAIVVIDRFVRWMSRCIRCKINTMRSHWCLKHLSRPTGICGIETVIVADLEKYTFRYLTVLCD